MWKSNGQGEAAPAQGGSNTDKEDKNSLVWKGWFSNLQHTLIHVPWSPTCWDAKFVPYHSCRFHRAKDKGSVSPVPPPTSPFITSSIGCAYMRPLLISGIGCSRAEGHAGKVSLHPASSPGVVPNCLLGADEAMPPPGREPVSPITAGQALTPRE